MDFTILMGANATGKSTRFMTFLNELTQSLGQWEDYEYTFFDHKKGKEITVVIGRLYSNGFLVMGKTSKNQAGWVSLDAAVLSTQDQRQDFYQHVMATDSDRVTRIFVEGYFNVTSPRNRPTALREMGFEQIDCFFMFYDTPEEFHQRATFRSGQDKGIEWAKTCAGWKDNLAFSRVFIKVSEEDLDAQQNVERLDINIDKDFLCSRYLESYKSL